jgi:transcriptional regulator with GAF, ATPase, and Fis domain
MTDDGTTLRREPGSVRAPEQSLLLYHRGGAKVVPLPPGASVVIGRSWPADAVVDDRSLSRQHARVTSAREGMTLQDLGSTNGTWLNGNRLGTDVVRIALGDVLRLGDVTAALHVVPTRSSAGIESHDRFRTLLEDEVRRAQSFQRPCSLLMLRARPSRAGASDGHVDRFAPALLGALRPVDRIGAYADDRVLVLLPETPGDAAATFAQAFGAEHDVLAGLASFPDDGATAEELIDAARRSLARGGPAVSRSIVPTAPERVVVQSARMRAVFDELARVAPSALPVLAIGETGTGKELVARAVHERSPRKDKPFRSVNCGAIPQSLVEGTLFGHERGAFTSADRTTKGLFEQAHGGTLFLDEIGELPAAAQAALLRVLETKRLMRVGGDREIEVDVRLVAATHRDLEAMAAEGAFRSDLLYRLNTVVVFLPPLRERPEEIDALVATFVAEANKTSARAVTGVDDAARAALHAWTWPGNVRELKNVIDRAVVIARRDRIGLDDLPERLRATHDAAPVAPAAAPDEDAPPPAVRLGAGIDFKERVKEQTRAYETELILAALKESGGNQTEAARLLGMPVRTFTHKLKELGIKKKFE